MSPLGKKSYNKLFQYVTSILLVIVIGVLCFWYKEQVDHNVVALLLLVAVSLSAIIFDVFPVLIAAILSALVLNFFFVDPLYTFHIHNGEDLLMFLMYFIVASVNAVLTIKIRKAEKKAREKEEKENTIKLYNTLLNSLSHELKTPIATIIGAVDTLKEPPGKLSVLQQAELLAEIGKAGTRLNQQVENLLNISRLESGFLKINTDWCDVNELIYTVIQKLSQETHPVTVRFTAHENLPLFKLDRGLIEQVVYNILHNAVIYGVDYPEITIQTAVENDQCLIMISDNGPGFPVDEIPYVFDKFYRLPHAKSGGTGLGLSIVKGFTEAHHGDVQLENIAGGGAKFTLKIPAEVSYINHLKNE